MLIYLVTNIVNGKKYIGQTVKSLKVRKRNHLSVAKFYKYNSYFHRALIKYGEETFDWKVLHDGIENIDDLNKLEAYYIGYYDTYGKGGYNLTLGGNGQVGRKVSAETKHKLSLANIGQNNPNYGKKPSAETRKKMSIANSGKNHPNYGKKLPAETRQKIAEATKGRKVSAETRKKQSIANSGKDSPVAKVVVINSRHFDTRNEAADFLGITPAAVRYRILHKTKWLDYYYAKSEKWCHK
jgi:group I intron endonuclease